MLQWEWLGGLPPLRRAAVIGAGSWGTAVAVMLARAGLEVDLGCRTARAGRPARRHARATTRYLPGVELPESRPRHARRRPRARRATTSSCFAVPAARAAGRGRRARRPRSRARAGVLVLSKGLVPPLGTLPVRLRRRARRRLGGRRRSAAPRTPPPRSTAAPRSSLAASDPAFAPPGRRRARRRRLRRRRPRTDVVGVELAGCAKNAAALAAAAAAAAGPNAAGAAAGKVFAEIDALARRAGSEPETFAGLAGTGDLVATVLAEGSRNRRAGELLAAGHAGRRHRRRARPDRRGRRVASRCSPRACARPASTRRCCAASPGVIEGTRRPGALDRSR